MNEAKQLKLMQAMSKPRKWFTVNLADTPEVLIYDFIGTDSWGDAVSPKAFREELKAVSAKSDKMNLRINSPGGYVHDGFSIYNALKDSGLKITTYVDGLAASAAAFIAMAGDEIYMPKAAEMMIHNAKGMAWGDADEMRKAATHMESLTATIAGIFADRTGMDKDEVLKMMAEETWMDAEQAVTLGFATAIDESMKAAACAFELDVFDKLPSGFARYQNALKKRAIEQAERDAGLSRAEAARRASNAAAGNETDGNDQKEAETAILKELRKWK